MLTIKAFIPAAVFAFSLTTLADAPVPGSPPPSDTNIVSQAERLPLQFIESAKVAFKNRDLQKTSDNLIGAARAIDANSKSNLEENQISSDSIRALNTDVVAKKDISINDFAHRLSAVMLQEASVQNDRAKFLWGRSEMHAAGSALNLAADYAAESERTGSAGSVSDAKRVAGELMANSGWNDTEVNSTIDRFNHSIGDLNKDETSVKSATTRSVDSPQ